ncbi:MAG: hypothetical protein C0604_04480, partial [Clostridiales bacterium]
LRFSLSLDGKIVAKQEINSFDIEKSIFMEKPVDVAIVVHDENDENVLSVEMPDFMLYVADGTIGGILDKYGEAESLTIEGSVKELDYISELEGLKYLSVLNSGIDDLRSLEKLKNLKILVVSGCDEIRDVSPIGELPKLESLVFRHCNSLEDIGPLSKLVNLRYIIMSGNINVEDISPLAELPNLEYVNISGSPKVKNISLLEDNENLQVDQN